MVALGLALTSARAAAGVGLVVPQGGPPHTIELPGHPGLLTSTSTRLPGLIAADDLRHPERLGSLDVPNAAARVARLERRFEQIHSARRWAFALLAGLTIAAILVALWRRTGFWRRFCVAIAPVMTSVALLLALGGAARPEVVLPLLAFGSVLLAAAIAVPRRLIRYLGPLILLLFLVVLWAWPETAGFSAIGPRPEEGGRFFGVTNTVETVLLAISLFSAAELGAVSVLPIAALALVTVGWSRTGADGGGLIVFAAAFTFLALRLAGPITPKRLAISAGAGVALVLAFIGIDEASGGHSHVTRAFEKGPAAWFGDIGHRLSHSADLLSKWHIALITAVSLVALVWLAFKRPRSPALDALLVGIAVSLIVNDAPSDVTSGGAISGFVLFAWATTRYTRARATPRPDPRGSGIAGRRLRIRGHHEAGSADRDRHGADDSDGQG